MGNLLELVTRNRSYRKFDASVPLSMTFLESLINLARLTPSSVNRQPYKFYLSNRTAENEIIFNELKWAALLLNHAGQPSVEERPVAYIIIGLDTTIAQTAKDVDVGILAQTMALGAVEGGYGCCMIGNFSAEHLSEEIGLPPHFIPKLILAIGKPVERIVVEELSVSGTTNYYRDYDGVHHVPKRSVQELILH